MAIVLLVAGIGFLLAGLLAVGFGIPINEFSFGNTLILAGSMAACTGAILIGVWMLLRELTEIARRLGGGAAVKPTSAAPATARGPAAESGGFLFGNGQPASEKPADPDAAAAPAPWQDEAAARDVSRNEAPADPPPAETPPQRRNLLFSSSSRKERERERARDKPAIPSEATLDIAPVAMPQPAATFEDAWPQAERSRAADPLPRRSSRSTSAEPAASADRHPPAIPQPAVPQEELPQVTVLKSGVVDGMAYSLYSDGSIEAQMPEGMMRFASIDELRSHLDHRP